MFFTAWLFTTLQLHCKGVQLCRAVNGWLTHFNCRSVQTCLSKSLRITQVAPWRQVYQGFTSTKSSRFWKVITLKVIHFENTHKILYVYSWKQAVSKTPPIVSMDKHIKRCACRFPRSAYTSTRLPRCRMLPESQRRRREVVVQGGEAAEEQHRE